MLRILFELNNLAAPGSYVAMDIFGLSFLKSPSIKPILDRLAAKGSPWNFGTDEPEALLTRAGFTEVEVVQPAEVGHGRWAHPVVPRSIQNVPRTYFVFAKKPF